MEELPQSCHTFSCKKNIYINALKYTLDHVKTCGMYKYLASVVLSARFNHDSGNIDYTNICTCKPHCTIIIIIRIYIINKQYHKPVSRSYNQISLFGRKSSSSATDLRTQTIGTNIQVLVFFIQHWVTHHGKKTVWTNKSVITSNVEMLATLCWTSWELKLSQKSSRNRDVWLWIRKVILSLGFFKYNIIQCLMCLH